jgi:hypothetical protein
MLGGVASRRYGMNGVLRTSQASFVVALAVPKFH